MSHKNNQEIDLVGVNFNFTQEGNTLGSTNGMEVMDVSLEYQLDSESGPFFVLRTETGWSFDDKEDIAKLLDYCVSAHHNFIKMGSLRGG